MLHALRLPAGLANALSSFAEHGKGRPLLDLRGRGEDDWNVEPRPLPTVLSPSG